jgi:four helix bundle protein
MEGQMNAEELQERTKKFAASVIRFAKTLPQHGPFAAVTGQLLAAGTSVAANYRASCRARSRVEFTAKMGVVAEEADETVFWLEVLLEGCVVRATDVAELLDEARQLRAITAASVKTARRNHAAGKLNQQISKSVQSIRKSQNLPNQSTNQQIKKSRDDEAHH